MTKTIVLAGATGNLGGRIAQALLDRNASVHLLVRRGSDESKTKELVARGARRFEVDMMNVAEVTEACTGAACLVSAVQGLRDVMVDTQAALLQAAMAAGVPRFIPSDYSTDFTALPAGSNRNFDLRKAFHEQLDATAIKPTSIFNGAFAEILSYGTPLLNLKNKTVGYWGSDPDWQMDFTTMDDTAAYTAEAALDEATPRALRIASFRVSPNDFVRLATAATGEAFRLVPMGSLESFAEKIKQQRAADPAGETQVYSAWQSAQYMHGMFSTHHAALDNQRYPNLSWTSAEEFIKRLL